MKKAEAKKARAMLETKQATTIEVIGLDGGGLGVTAYFSDGSQRIFYSLDAVLSHIAERGHGGARDGAGRDSLRGEAKVTTSLRVTPQIKRFFESTESASETVESIVRRSQAFKKWKQSEDVARVTI